MSDAGAILGRGIAFPPRVGPDGRVAVSQGEQNVRESLEILLRTELRERLRRPDFGAGLASALFEPNTTATHRLIEERITRAIEAWEPRVALAGVVVAADARDPEAATATVEYKHVATQTTGRVAVTIGLGG